jgi:hypothetical protein
MRREVIPEEGGFPRRERPWAAVIDKRAVAEPSCPPSAQDSKSMGESSAELSLTFSSPA